MVKTNQIITNLKVLFINRKSKEFSLRFTAILQALLILVFAWCTNSNSAKAQAYNFNYLSIQNGLPQSQAFSILFDENQYAWIGTQGGGLCRFDGLSFRYFTKNDSLISNRIYATKILGDKIWIGQKGGVTVMSTKGDFVRNYRLENPTLLVRDLVYYKGDYLIATDDGIFRLDNNQWVSEHTNPGIKDLNCLSFFQASDTVLWLCSDVGLISYSNPFGRLTKAKGLSNAQIECAVEFQGEWVLGAYEGGLNFYNKSSIYRKEVFAVLDNEIILSLFVSASGELWIGTMNSGVFVYNPNDEVLRNYRSSNGLSGNHVKTIAADYWDNIWIGTSGGGVSIFQNSPFIEYNSSSGLNGDYVFSVLNDHQNNLWLGTEGTGVMRINDTSKVLFDEEYGFSSTKVKCIFEDKDGDIWMGTEGKGLGIYSKSLGKDTIFSYYNSNGLKGNWVKCFVQNPTTNQIYIGTSDGGIFTVFKSRNFPENISFKSIPIKKGEAPRDLTALAYYKNKLWFAEDDGHYGFIENDQVTTFYDSGKSFRNVVCSGNRVWIGSKDDGILTLELDGDSVVNKKWILAGTTQGIQSNNVYQLLYYNNQLWVGTEKGLDRLDLDSAYNITTSEHFGYEEGFEGVETNINASQVDYNGNLWFGTVDGLFVYKGRDVIVTPRKQPVLHISDFQIVFESIERTAYAKCFDRGQMIHELLLPYNKNHISIRFQAIHYSQVKNIKYRWKMEGIDPDWAPSTAVNIATYPNLPPGDYTFKVQSTVDNTWSEKPLEIKFKIDQPYWEKFWFKFTYYSAGVLVVLIIIFIIYYRLRRKSRALNEKLKLEKNLLELEQKALRLQMNPHFIFNVLNSIHNLIILNDSDKARYALSKFSKLMRQVLENSREKFISIDDEVLTLQNYVQLERLTSNLTLELNFTYDDDLDTAEAILPPLIIQPFVENAIIHGLKGIDRPGEISIHFGWYQENVLQCSVSDNGIGRQKASENKAQQMAHHKSTALRVVQERLANLNQESTFIPFEIIDLNDKEGNAVGTKIIIRILV